MFLFSVLCWFFSIKKSERHEEDTLDTKISPSYSNGKLWHSLSLCHISHLCTVFAEKRNSLFLLIFNYSRSHRCGAFLFLSLCFLSSHGSSRFFSSNRLATTLSLSLHIEDSVGSAFHSSIWVDMTLFLPSRWPSGTQTNTAFFILLFFPPDIKGCIHCIKSSSSNLIFILF